MSVKVSCQGCFRATATTTLGANNYCQKCCDILKQYYFCKYCGKSLPLALGKYLAKRFEFGHCDECKTRHLIETGQLCCDQANIVPCVCVRSYKCPIHGETHVGTHD